MIYDLPENLEVCGEEYEIRSDFRAVLDVIEILNDSELNEQERGYLALLFFYSDIKKMPPEHYQDALKKCFWFINGGSDEEPDGKQPRLMDWQQDFPYIIASINRVIGHEVRSDKHLHWWTFLSAYMEIGECTFAQIVHIRDANNKGKKLDASDREWYRKNRKIVDLKQKYTPEEEQLLKYWGGE